MNVISPLDTNHTITLVPRFEPIGDLVFTLLDKSKDTEVDISNTYIYSDGKLALNFDLDTTEDYRYNFKISKDSIIIYRGSLFATSQDPQNYNMIYE